MTNVITLTLQHPHPSPCHTVQTFGNQQGIVTYISVEPFTTGIKAFDLQKFVLIALKKGP